MARLKLDENMPDSVADALRAAGHDVELARDEDLAGAVDDDLLAHASAEGRALVTLDLDFADVVRHPPGSTAGIVVLRPQRETITLINRVASLTGSLLGKETVEGRLWIADQIRIRIWPESDLD